jgi:23S rRNA (cytosine1962-C5)-methyltransferase
MDKIIVRRPGRVIAGHNWIFSNELSQSPKRFSPGSLVEVRDMKDGFIGIGYVNPASLIAVRLLTRENERIDAAFFRKRILAALAHRENLGLRGDSFRVIFSEGDFLPGLIADKFSDCLVLQFLTFGMEALRETVIPLLDEILSPSVIVLRNDSRSRELEGLPLCKEVIKGSLDKLPVIHEGEVSFEIDPIGGQKTGFFLDQRENRLAFAELLHGGEGLDLFCYCGAWGLQAAKKGAAVRFVDDSETALSRVRSNAAGNGCEDRLSYLKADVFAFLKDELNAGRRYDFIVLDPPAFAKSRLKIKEALRGYREINSLAMRLLKEGGLLATSSCSYHVDRQAFPDMLRDAARDAGRQARFIEYRSQGRDHPVLLSMPETEYLKCAFLRF